MTETGQLDDNQMKAQGRLWGAHSCTTQEQTQIPVELLRRAVIILTQERDSRKSRIVYGGGVTPSFLTSLRRQAGSNEDTGEIPTLGNII